MTPSIKAIDKEFLKSFYKELVDEIGEIFQLFIEEVPNDLKEINLKLQEKNYTEVALLLHRVAPCFYNVGLPILTKKIKNIEDEFRLGNFETASNNFINFEKELEEYMPAIHAECKRLMP